MSEFIFVIYICIHMIFVVNLYYLDNEGKKEVTKLLGQCFWYKTPLETLLTHICDSVGGGGGVRDSAFLTSSHREPALLPGATLWVARDQSASQQGPGRAV